MLNHMAASNEYKLCHVYELPMKTSSHNIQRDQRQTLGKRKLIFVFKHSSKAIRCYKSLNGTFNIRFSQETTGRYSL